MKPRGAAIAQWIRLRLPSCCPGFKSQACHLCFNQFIFELCHVENTEINQKEAGIGPFKKLMHVSISKYLGCTIQAI